MDLMFIVIVIGVVSLLAGAAGMFFIKKIQDEKKRVSAAQEAEKILNRAKGEAARLDKDAKNKAKEFETRARKNVEVDIQKQKAKLQQQERSYEDKEKRLEQQFKSKEDALLEKDRMLKDREEKHRVADSRFKDLERQAQETLGFNNNSRSGLFTDGAIKPTGVSFNGNRYHMPNTTSYVWEWNGVKNWFGLRSSGQEANGTLDTNLQQ